MFDEGFSEPRRQSPLGVLILYGENLRKLINIVLALVFAKVFTDGIYFSTSTVVIIGAILIAVYTVLQYLRFKFHLTDDELILHKGVLQRERLAIPFDRIQSVHLSQNILQQILQLTAVKIDTAGSGKQELKISALKRADAEALQQLLSSKKSAVEAPDVSLESQVAQSELSPREILVKLTIGKLLIVGLTQNHIKNGFAVVGLVMGYLWQFEKYIGDYLRSTYNIDPEVWQEQASMFEWGLMAIGAMGTTFLVIAVLFSLITTVLKHFGFEASLSQKNIKISSGLLKRNEHTIPINKIQMMSWKGNVLRRIFGFESVLIRQTKSDDAQVKNLLEIPACYSEQTEKLEAAIYGEARQGEFSSYSPHGYYKFYLIMLFTAFGTLPFVIAYLNIMDWRLILVYALYITLVILLVYRYYRSLKLVTNGDLIIRKRGWLSTDRTLLKVHKIQSIRMSQSIFQARRGTAHLTMYTAGGQLTMRFMPEQLVRELYNYSLYRVETTERDWM